MSQKKKKPKTKFQSKRKQKEFVEIIRHYTSVVSLTMPEITAMLREQGEEPEFDAEGRLKITVTNLPEGAKYVETLNGHWVFDEKRLESVRSIWERLMKEFDDKFWEEPGQSIVELRRDFKGRVWGLDQDIQFLVAVALGLDLAEWSYPRSMWQKLKDGLPYIKFKGPKRGNQGEQEQSTSKVEFENGSSIEVSNDEPSDRFIGGRNLAGSEASPSDAGPEATH